MMHACGQIFMLLVCQNWKCVIIGASIFVAFKRRDSVTVTQVLFELGLQSFYTLILTVVLFWSFLDFVYVLVKFSFIDISRVASLSIACYVFSVYLKGSSSDVTLEGKGGGSD